MDALGRHVIVEFWNCNDSIDSADAVKEAMIEAIDAIGATLLNLHVQTFQPQGVTGLAVLAESHFSVHSWPEHGYLAADIFTCGTTTRPEMAAGVLRRHFQPQRVEVYELPRGVAATSRNGLQLKRLSTTEDGRNCGETASAEPVREPRGASLGAISFPDDD